MSNQQIQLSLALFDLRARTPDGYSNTVDAFDLLMRYSATRVRQKAEQDNWQVTIGDNEYHVSLTPAIVKSKEKVQIMMPGRREDLVEKCLRKTSAEDPNSCATVEDSMGRAAVVVRFTIYQIRKLLGETGHEYKGSEIVEAIRILAGSHMQIRGQKLKVAGERNIPLISEWSSIRPTDGDETGKREKCWVMLNPLITASFIERTYRRINFRKLMGMRMDLGRWLYQRMSHTMADPTSECVLSGKFTISLETVLRESGMPRHNRLRSNIDMVHRALEEMVKGRVLASFEENLIYPAPGKPGPKSPENAIWALIPSDEVSKDAQEQMITERNLKVSSNETKRT